MLEAADELEVSIEQGMDKAPWFQRLNAAWADVPVQALDDAKLRVSPSNSPGIVLNAALNLGEPRFVWFRVLSSIYNPTLFRAYTVLLMLGLKGESIVDQSLYERLHEERGTHFLDDSDYDNFDISRVEETMTLGIGIYDEKQVAIGTYNEVDAGEHITMILSSSDSIVEWGCEWFDLIRVDVWPALESDTKTVIQ